MLNEPWKTRLIRYAHLNQRHSVHLATQTGSSRVVLGRTLHKRAVMSASMKWLDKIQGEVRQNEPMSKHTSLRVGGPADLFIIPKDIDDVKTIYRHLGETPLFVLGEGTNLLVSDRGFRGIVLSLSENFKSIQAPLFWRTAEGEEKAVVKVGAGVKMSYLVKYLARYSLTGIEDLVGIPGSLGGAVIMNAGAEGTEIGQAIRSVTRVTSQGEIEVTQKKDLIFRYRKTLFPDGGGIVVEAELELKKGEAVDIQNKIDRHLSRRRNTQPLSLPNSGSVFKNPEGDKAGRLIEAAGLKGFSIGEAGISIKHANFIVNKGEAQAADVLDLIRHIQKVVREKTGVDLETEVVIAGDW